MDIEFGCFTRYKTTRIIYVILMNKSSINNNFKLPLPLRYLRGGTRRTGKRQPLLSASSSGFEDKQRIYQPIRMTFCFLFLSLGQHNIINLRR